LFGFEMLTPSHILCLSENIGEIPKSTLRATVPEFAHQPVLPLDSLLP
jgi:hypothetical protein